MKTTESFSAELLQNKQAQIERQKVALQTAAQLEAEVISIISEYMPEDCTITASSNIYEPSVTIKIGNGCRLYLNGRCNDADANFTGNMVLDGENHIELLLSVSSLNASETNLTELKMAHYTGVLANAIACDGEDIKSRVKKVMEAYLPIFKALIRETAAYYATERDFKTGYSETFVNGVLNQMLVGYDFEATEALDFEIPMMFEAKPGKQYSTKISFNKIQFIKLKELKGKPWYKVEEIRMKGDDVVFKEIYLKKSDIISALTNISSVAINKLLG